MREEKILKDGERDEDNGIVVYRSYFFKAPDAAPAHLAISVLRS